MPFCIPQASGHRPRKCGQYLLVAALLASFAVVPASLRSEPIHPLVMATNQPDTTYEGKWQRRVYQEAFRRLGVPIEVTLMPTLRMTAMADSGAVDGQFVRVFGYADAHPEQVRVEEPIYQVLFGLWVSNPALNLSRLGDLAATSWIGMHGDPIALHPYLHKKHAELAGRLAAVLKQMKADGSLERFRREVKYELTGQ